MFLKSLVLVGQTFELLQTLIVLDALSQLVAEALLLDGLASLTNGAGVELLFKSVVDC